jgi:hypothetical protein
VAQNDPADGYMARTNMSQWPPTKTGITAAWNDQIHQGTDAARSEP